MGKENPELISVYQDTMAHAPFVKGDIDYTVTSKYSIEDMGFRPIRGGVISVWNTDSISAAIKARQKDPYAKICMLNMASRKRPGGGVRNGARAQEEDLFRCTTLGMDIPEKHYPLEEHEYLYTESAYIIKDADYERVFPVEIDVVSMPAINLNVGKWNEEKNDYDTEIQEKPQGYATMMIKKIRAICGHAASRGCNTLILGAWGCGVFKNEPDEVALFFKTVLEHEGFATQFKQIIFPVINDKNSRDNNYEAFKKVFSI